jgi:hypothetical protein
MTGKGEFAALAAIGVPACYQLHFAFFQIVKSSFYKTYDIVPIVFGFCIASYHFVGYFIVLFENYLSVPGILP